MPLLTSLPPSLFAGFGLGFSLILAIGAQNAFVLRQGLRRQHVFWVGLACAGSDALLIASGVLGFGSLAVAFPWFEPVMRFGGAAFLAWYGARSLLAAWRGGDGSLADLVRARSEWLDAKLKEIDLSGQYDQQAAALHFTYAHHGMVGEEQDNEH
mgnify:CR=1 FL=1